MELWKKPKYEQIEGCVSWGRVQYSLLNKFIHILEFVFCLNFLGH